MMLSLETKLIALGVVFLALASGVWWFAQHEYNRGYAAQSAVVLVLAQRANTYAETLKQVNAVSAKAEQEAAALKRQMIQAQADLAAAQAKHSQDKSDWIAKQPAVLKQPACTAVLEAHLCPAALDY